MRDTQADMAEDTPLLHRAEVTSAVAARFPRRAVTSIAAIAAVGILTGDARITAAGDIMALDSAWAFMRLMDMDMPRQRAIRPASMTSTVRGNTILAARFLTATEPVTSGVFRLVRGPHYHNGEFCHQCRIIPDHDPTDVAFVDKGPDLVHEISSENLHFLDKVL